MKATSDFSPIAPDEAPRYLSVDFSTYLISGDTVATIVAWNCTVAAASPTPDPDPASRLIGAPAQAGDVVVQHVGGCLAGVIYIMEAVVDTTAGERLSIWAYLKCVAVGVG